MDHAENMAYLVWLISRLDVTLSAEFVYFVVSEKQFKLAAGKNIMFLE